tara:strand:+ start:881 stop:1129 length:249 start_codon:yes stop_codon:yes gene_type:complete
MSENIEELKKKIIYRASYRGTKEMDILMYNFVNSLINDLKFNELEELHKLVNLDDESLQKIKNKNLLLDNSIIIKKFIEFTI